MLGTNQLRESLRPSRWLSNSMTGDPLLGTNLLFGAAVLIAGIVCGLLVFYRGPIALIPSALVLLGGLLTVRFGRASTASLEVRMWWIPWAWLALFLVSDHRFEKGSPNDVLTGDVSSRIIIELGVYALIAAIIVVYWRALRRPHPFSGLPAFLLAWPAVALVSTLWSIIPKFTLVRAGQLFVPVLLAVCMLGLGRRDPEVAESLWWRSLRLLVNVIILLVLIGLATGSTATDYEGGEGRFAWPGVHSVQAGILSGAALLAVITGGRWFTRSSIAIHAAKIAILTLAVVRSQTRGAVASLLVAIVALLWIAGRRRPIVRLLAVPGLVTGAIFAWSSSRSQIVEYALRGGTEQGLETLNGRIPLWELTFQVLAEGGKWLTGFGYGSSRVLLFERVSWAGTAHNSWVELLMGVGIVGVAIAIIGCFLIGKRLLERASRESRAEVMLFGLFIYLVVNSLTAEFLALPGFGFSVLAFLLVRASASRTSNLADDSHHPGRLKSTGTHHQAVGASRA
jgi:hypothetical protein